MPLDVVPFVDNLQSIVRNCNCSSPANEKRLDMSGSRPQTICASFKASPSTTLVQWRLHEDARAMKTPRRRPSAAISICCSSLDNRRWQHKCTQWLHVNPGNTRLHIDTAVARSWEYVEVNRCTLAFNVYSRAGSLSLCAILLQNWPSEDRQPVAYTARAQT